MGTIRRLLHILTPSEQRSALWLLVLMFLGMVLETIGIGAVIPLVTLLTQGDLFERYPRVVAFFGLSADVTQAQVVIWLMLILVVAYAVKNTFLCYLVWQQTKFAFDVQVEISQRLFATYLHQPYTFHLQRNSAHLLRNITGEVSLLATVITCTLLVLTEGLVLLGVTGLLFFMEPLGTFVVTLILGVLALLFSKFTRSSVLRWGTLRQRHDVLRVQHLQQGLNGVKDVKLLGREQDFLDQHNVHNIQTARAGELQTTLQQIPRMVLELLAVLGLALLVISIVGRSDQGFENVIPTLALFAAAAFRLMPSVNRILAAMQTVRFGHPVINTLYGELQLGQKVQEPARPAGKTELNDEIRLQEVHYTYYGSSHAALEDINLTVRRGECVGLIGPSGSGKSTLVDIFLGLLKPDSGVVTVDGNDINHDLRQWQNQIGYVPQSIYLTDDTLRRNVAFGVPANQIDDAAVTRAVKAAQLEEFVSSLEHGIETMVGERGVRISGGQRQRVGIARALYHDPGVLLLDEATSALDSETENGVMQAVSALQGKKTIVIVAHRLSTVGRCNKLYRIERGRLVAEGPPQDLLPDFQATTFY